MKRAVNARHGTTVQGHVQWPPGRKVKYLRPPWVLLTALAACLLALVAGGPGYAQQAPPGLVEFQGRLTNASGVPLNGNYDVEIEFYNQDDTVDPPDGTLFLTDRHTAAFGGQVTVTNGVYVVTLGGGSPLSGSYGAMTDMFAGESAVWLQVKVGAERLYPRTRLLAAAYALNADALDGRTSGNASGNIPISNGTVNANLNADLLDGLDSTYFAPASGSNSYVQLAPAAAQTWTSANTGIFLNETGGANPFLMHLQTGGSDMFIVGNSGNVNVAGDLQVIGNDIQDSSGNSRLNLGTTVSTPAGTHFSVTGNTTLGDAGADSMTFNATSLTIPNNLNIDSNTFYIDASGNRVGIGTASPNASLHVVGRSLLNSSGATTGSDGIAMSIVKPSGASNSPTLELLS